MTESSLDTDTSYSSGYAIKYISAPIEELYKPKDSLYDLIAEVESALIEKEYNDEALYSMNEISY